MGVPEGQGTLTLIDGRVFHGAMLNGLAHGTGTLVCPKVAKSLSCRREFILFCSCRDAV